MTRDDIVTEVLKRMGRYSNPLDTDLQSDLVNSFNTVCDEFPQLYEWYCVQAPVATITLVAGTSDYALPSDCAEIWSVRDSTNEIILTYADMTEIEGGTRQTGPVPNRYGRWGDYLTFDPYPSVTDTGLAVIKLRYTVPLTQPSAGGTTLITYSGKTLPSKFRELLVRGTLFYAYKNKEMTAEAVEAKVEYCGLFPEGPLGGYALFLKQGETRWQQIAWDPQVQPRFK